MFGLVSFLTGCWVVTLVVWLIVTFVLTLAFGGLVVFAPYVPQVAAWMKSITLFDLMPWGLAYAVVMSLIGMGFFTLPVHENLKWPHYHTRDKSDIFAYVVSLVGAPIFIALVVGVFMFRSNY